MRVAYEISRELVRRGHEVTVYTTDSLDRDSRIDLSGDRPSDLEGISVYYFRNLSNWLAGKHRIQISPSIVGVARGNMRGFDVVHLHGYRTFQNAVVCHYAQKYGIPYLLHAHGTLPNTPPKRALKSVYDYLWGRQLLADAARVLAISTTEAGHYRSMGVPEDRILMTPNGVALNGFSALPPRGAFRRRHGIEDSEKLILYMGRLHESKGIDLVVRAFAKLARERDDVWLALVGPDDGYLATLRRVIEDCAISPERTLLPGPVYDRGKLELLVDADVFVTPRFAGFPVTFVEACACGLPIVTTTQGDKLEWLDGQAGLVVAYDDERLREALQTILGNDALRQRLGERGRRLVREEFNWGRIVSQLEEVYGAVAGEGDR